jgi:hypothetical protein
MKLSKKLTNRKHSLKDISLGNYRKKLYQKYYGNEEVKNEKVI